MHELTASPVVFALYELSDFYGQSDLVPSTTETSSTCGS